MLCEYDGVCQQLKLRLCFVNRSVCSYLNLSTYAVINQQGTFWWVAFEHGFGKKLPTFLHLFTYGVRRIEMKGSYSNIFFFLIFPIHLPLPFTEYFPVDVMQTPSPFSNHPLFSPYPPFSSP